MNMKPAHVYTSPVGTEYAALLLGKPNPTDERVCVKIFCNRNTQNNMELTDWVLPSSLRLMKPEDTEKFLGHLL